MSIDYRIVVPSKGRSLNVEKIESLLGPVTLLVYEDEYKEYSEKAKTSEVMVPGKSKRLVEKRQWALDTFEEESIIFCDDDLMEVACIVGRKRRYIKDFKDIRKILENQIRICKDLNLHSFTFYNQIYKILPAFKPFDMYHLDKTYLRSLYGIVGRDFKYDQKLTLKPEIDLSLQLYKKDRIILNDMRFIFIFKNVFKNKGGLQDVRTKTTEDACKSYIKEKWGDSVSFSKSKNNTNSVSTRIMIHRKQ